MMAESFTWFVEELWFEFSNAISMLDIHCKRILPQEDPAFHQFSDITINFSTKLQGGLKKKSYNGVGMC